jgi:tetratricopeptide (TPR) repeat protein
VRGWGWVRVSTIAGVVVLALSTVAASVALLMRLADKQHDLLVSLSIWSAVLAGLGFVVAAIGKIADLRATRVRQDAQWQATVRGLLRESPHGALPRLSELSDAALGATPTQYTATEAAPYVHRPAADARLAELLAGGPPFGFVVVVGASKAGKSRTAARAARSQLGGTDPYVVVPRDGEALAALMRLDPPLPVVVPTPVWLDDLTAADLSHLGGDVLDAVARQGWLVATMTEDRWDEILNSGGEIAATARAALRRATRVSLDFELDESEAAQARRFYPQEHIAVSIGETLVGGQWLMDRYRAGRTGNPAGYAIVQAAVDARRAGLSRPIGRDELLRLFPLYLRRIRIDLDPTTSRFDEGLAWAKQPVASQVALITTTPDGAGKVLDYVVAVADGGDDRPARPILDQLWAELIGAIPVTDAFDVGFGAYLRAKTTVAIMAMRRASGSADPDLAPLAARNLGVLLAEQGDIGGALAAYQQVIDSDHPDQAPKAAFNLGMLLAEQGDIGGALAAYQQVIDSDHPDQAPTAANNLGMLLHRQGDIGGAVAAYQGAIDSGDPAIVSAAADNLGLLLDEQGDVNGAIAAYQLAIDSGDPDQAPTAATHLGRLLQRQGDIAGALAAYQQVVDSAHPGLAPAAMNDLGVLLGEQGDIDGALTAYQRAIDSADPAIASAAANNLGTLLDEQGDVDGAMAAYQRAIDSGHPDTAPMAAFNLGLLLQRLGDVNGAMAAYQQVIDSGHPDTAPMAAFNLGLLLDEQGDVDGALAAYQLAIDSGHPEESPKAAREVARLRSSFG